MSDAANDILPDDPQALRSMILALKTERKVLARERDNAARERDDAQRRVDHATRQNQQLEAEKQRLESNVQRLEAEKLALEMKLLKMKKLYYGPRADTLKHYTDVAQLLLEFATGLEARPIDPQDLPPDVHLPPETDLSCPDAGKSLRRVKKGRRNLAGFDKLPVIRKEHDLSESEKPCPCCGEMRHPIGQETSWQVEYIPGHFERIEHVRLKYACSRCEAEAENPQIILADKPLQPIDKGMAGPGLLAYVITSKYADYLPLYRLEDIFQRNGLEIDRAAQCLWCRDVAELVKPVYDRMVQRLLQSHVLCTDDTVMPMQSPGSGKTAQARMWVYVGDRDHPYNCFDFTPGRGRDGPAKFLRTFNQTLLADGYGGYDGVVVASGITRAGCWAHARRKFVDAEKTQPLMAKQATDLIGGLYDLERQAKEMTPAQRQELRQKQSQPIIDKLHGHLLTWKQQLLPKHPMAEAVNYTLNQWRELSVFAGDGVVPIDNNISEREMKRVVLNRKNSLFVGNPRGGQTAAILSSLTSTCRRHDIDPQKYLTQLLTNLPTTKMSQLETWLPDQWKASQQPDRSGVGLG